jgi:predicted peptidase
MFKQDTFGKMQYVIKFPKGFCETEKYPTLIFMHGAGSRGTDIELLKGNPFFKITENHNDLPFVIFAPQCSGDTWFDSFTTVNDFAKFVGTKEYVDFDKIYLMGASMGGYAVWQMAMSNPSFFAAIVPICGGGMYWNAGRLKGVPIWAFHGDSDTTVYTEESVKMVNAVNENGGNAKLTIYENCGHDAWSDTYGNIEVFKWLLSHKKNNNEAVAAAFNDSKIYG